jgi:hypothetical protein
VENFSARHFKNSMSENENHNSLPIQDADVRNGAEGFRTLPNDSASFGNIPKASEPFRTVRNDAESFRTVPKHSERKENHTLTVREAARMFEAAGVARTERSITNWCQPNRTGIARLDSYYDPNERKYYISPQSVELAIVEEKAKAAKINDSEPFGKDPQDAESFRTVPNHAETNNQPLPNDSESREVKELENEIRDLQITNKAKDMFIEQMQKERNVFLEQVISANRKVGELETKLLQLDQPRS